MKPNLKNCRRSGDLSENESTIRSYFMVRNFKVYRSPTGRSSERATHCPRHAALICFVIAFSRPALFSSNLHLVPATHSVYELCWSFLLPLSLSTIILGNPLITTGQSSSTPCIKRGTGTRAPLGPMSRIGLLFTIGTIGSIAGVTAAFQLATSSVKALAISPKTAAQIAGAITASYIGGSVNFFAVASAVGLREAGDGKGGSLLGALAASDIMLMAIYFSGLFAAHRTPYLRRIFPGRGVQHESTLASGSATGTESSSTQRNKNGEPLEAVPASHGRHAFPFQSTLYTIGLASAVCKAANVLARLSPLPGTSTIVVAILTILVARALQSVAPACYAEMMHTAPLVSTTSLNIFFASVGASGLWSQVVGVATPVFVFSLVALVVHVTFMTISAAILNRMCGDIFGLDDMIVASNANIGGPSTAAAFAGLIGQDLLVIPAAVWGTFGYAVATTLGIGMCKVLQ